MTRRRRGARGLLWIACFATLTATVLGSESAWAASRAQTHGYTYDELFGSGSDSAPGASQPAAEPDGKADADDEAGAENEADPPDKIVIIEEKGEEANPKQEEPPAAAPKAEEKPAAQEEKPAAHEEEPAAQEEKPAAQEEEPAAQEDKPAAEPAAKGPKGYPLVSNVFYETDLSQALLDVGGQTGATIVADDSVQGSITLDLQDVPLEDALRLMLLPGGFVFIEVEKGVYLVTSPDPSSPNFARIAKSEIIHLDYIEGDELKQLLPNMYRTYVTFDTSGNRVVVTAPKAQLEATIARIRELDTRPVQVMMEALVVETSRAALTQLALMAEHDNVAVDTTTGLVTYVEQAQDLLYRVLWLASKDQAKIRANPRVVAQEGKEAEVRVATERYFQILTGRVGWEYVRLEQIAAPIALTITPRVAESDNAVTCRIQPEISDVTGTGPNSLPIITRRTADTTVCVGDGEVIAIGGLLQEVERVNRSKIPLLGDLPLFGSLFRSEGSSTEQREVVIFIVPHILDEQGKFKGPLLFERLSAEGP